MRRLISILFLVSGFYASAQSLKPSVISSAGTSVTVGNLQVSWTLGETFTQTYTSGSNQVTQGFQQVFPSLDLNALGYSSLCAGQTYPVSFTAVLVKGNGNVFTAQLSNASGNFAIPVNIGTLTSTSSGTIQAVIPLSATPGTGYRIRVISSNIALTSKDNGANLSISSTPVLTSLSPAQGAITSNILLLGSTLTNVTSVKFNAISTTFTVNNDNQITAVVPVGATNGWVIVANVAGCSDTVSGFQVVSQTCATPIGTPQGGTYGPPQMVTLTTATAGADIYYTTNGILPTPGNGATKLYSGPIAVTGALVTLKARAFKNGFVQSAPLTANYTISNICGAVTVTPVTGNYAGSQLVTMSCPTAGATIYYATTGNVPLPGSVYTRIYSAPFWISASASIRAYASKTDYVDGPVAVSNLTVSGLGTLTNVQFSPVGGTYANAQNVTLSTSEVGTTIYYTTNGNTPLPGTAYTQTYSGPIFMASSGTIKAFSYKPSYFNSPVLSQNYTITNPAIVANPVFSPGPGICALPCNITITCSTVGAQIWYTTTGNTPDPASPLSKLYTAPISLTKATQLKAKAFLTGYLPSAVVVGNYTLPGAFSRQAVDGEEPMRNLALFPNPTSGSLTISGIPPAETPFVKVWNAAGRLISAEKMLATEEGVVLNLKDQPVGLYQIEILLAGERKVLRVVKQ